jgi:uncharacterized membrane protein YphA (DoxX/SURF4 family)
MNLALWIIQFLLALLFLWAGGAKLIMTIAEMTALMSLPGWFLRFLGVAEILGGLGLVLPGLLHNRPGLTPLAAACLIPIMIGATAITIMTMGFATALLRLITGLLLIFVAYGRWRLKPLR